MHRSLVRASALSLTLLAAASCGGSSGPSSPSPAPSNNFTITVTRQNGAQSFSPNPALAGGQMVVFRNADTVVHRVRLNDLSIDTGDLAPGASSMAVRMPTNGTNYHCSLHPDMIGAVAPQAGGPPPMCEGLYC